MTYQVRNDRLYINGAEAPFAKANSFGGSLDPELIVLHDTAGRLDKGNSVAWFTNESCPTSAHVVVELDGTITQLVPFNRVAYHAGQSSWKGRQHCNAFSIGIEIVNPGLLDAQGRAWFHKQNRDPKKWQAGFPVADLKKVKTNEHGAGLWMGYTAAQVSAVTELCKALVAAYPRIQKGAITTHWAISPGRKIDTNPLFPLDAVRRAVFAPAEQAEAAAEPVEPLAPVVVKTAGPVALAKSIYESRSIWAAIVGVFWTAIGVVSEWARTGWEWIVWAIGASPAIYREVKDSLTPLQEMANWVGVNMKGISIAIATVCIVVVVVRHAALRIEAKG